MTPKQRWLIIGSLLLATLAAGYMIDDEPPPEKDKTKKSATKTSVASSSTQASRRTSTSDKEGAVASLSLDFPGPAIIETEKEEKAIDPFRNKSWIVPPPPAPPAKPTAPPLPFQYLGKIMEDSGVRVFLNHQGKNLIVKAGDVINGVYTVADIAGNQITFLYIPLKEKQALTIGADN